CWLLRGRQRVQLAAGDIVLLPRGQRHALADDPRSPRLRLEEWLNGPGSEAAGEAWRPLGSRSGAATEVLCGVYVHAPRALRQPIFDLLPDVLHVRARGGRASAELEATVSSLRAESARGVRGSALIVSRLLDILFVQIIRAWADEDPASAGWIGALRDPCSRRRSRPSTRRRRTAGTWRRSRGAVGRRGRRWRASSRRR